MIYTIFKHKHTHTTITVCNGVGMYTALSVDGNFYALYSGADFQCESELKKLYLQNNN